MEDGSQSLIIYFSMSGTTEAAAQQIQKATGADIVRLQRATPYPRDYSDYTKVADYERQHHIHPAIMPTIPNLAKYQLVLIGYPAWWSQPPMVIRTLFDDYDFRGKTIIPFMTSMSTSMQDSMPTMCRLAKQAGATIENGFRYDGNKDALKQFLQQNHLLK